MKCNNGLKWVEMYRKIREMFPVLEKLYALPETLLKKDSITTPNTTDVMLVMSLWFLYYKL